MNCSVLAANAQGMRILVATIWFVIIIIVMFLFLIKLTFFIAANNNRNKNGQHKDNNIIWIRQWRTTRKNETMVKFFTFIKQLKVYIRLFHFTVHMPIFPINWRTIFNTTIYLQKDKREIWWHAYIQIVFMLLSY